MTSHRPNPSRKPRSATGIPPALVEISDAERHLWNTLRKVPGACPPSMRRMLAKMCSAIARQQINGRIFIDPGHDKLADWGKCSVSQVKRNLAVLQNHGVVVASPGKLGRGWKRGWSVDYLALKVWLVRIRANPGKKLLDRLDALLPRLDGVQVEKAEPARNGAHAGPDTGAEKGRVEGAERGAEKGRIKGRTACIAPIPKRLEFQQDFFDLLHIPTVATSGDRPTTKRHACRLEDEPSHMRQRREAQRPTQGGGAGSKPRAPNRPRGPVPRSSTR